MKKVFISGPYSHGDIAINVKNAMETASKIIEMGAAPFCPHLYHFLHIHREQDYNKWLEIDISFMLSCDCIYVIDGYSPGSEREIEIANENNIPIFKTFDILDKYINKKVFWR